MILDARRWAEGTTLEADVCIVGAGPAGLILAAELVDHGLAVLLLESGGETTDRSVLSLNQGSVSGDSYAGLVATRHRQIGGSTAIWNTPVHGSVGAKYVPLDPVDFRERPARSPSGWPFEASVLAPYYERAVRWCGLAATTFDAADWAGPERETFAALGPPLVSRVYQLGTRERLVAPALARLREAGNARICSYATVVRLETNAKSTRATGAEVAAPGGPRWKVAAGRFVLAGGAVENARLLLVSSGRPEGLGNHSGWVGRCFMEHPRDSALRLRPQSAEFYRSAGFYDVHDVDGAPILGRLGLDAGALETGELPNASATLLPLVRRSIGRARRLIGPLSGLDAMSRLLPAGGHGWSRHPFPERVFEGMTVLLNLEQTPHPENRITLGRRPDALGVPIAELRWRWRPEDQRRLVKLREAVAGAIEAAGLGRVEIDETARPDPNAHHHAGTTRMHADPREGVVDPDGLVHGVENVYVAGASLFPTAGCANPLLTIVAMSIRLADHLARSG